MVDLFINAAAENKNNIKAKNINNRVVGAHDGVQEKVFNLLGFKGSIKNITKSDYDYLESKLHLYSNIKPHFDSIPSLKIILHTYMFLNEKYEDKANLKQVIKNEIISAGVYNDEEILQFLLLIAEKKRSFNDCPEGDISDEELGKYYFDKYKTEEKWAENNYIFFLKRTKNAQACRHRKLEEAAIKTIINVRSYLERAINPTPKEILELIKKVNLYFQDAFYHVFGKKAPVSLTEVTCITRDLTEHADRICGKTFINIDNYNKNKDEFIHQVIHEAMHLCFNGFREAALEEGIIEYFIEKMFKEYSPKDFIYSPICYTYTDWKNNLKAIFTVLPDADKHFLKYFLAQDLKQLKDYFRVHFTKEIEQKILIEHYCKGLSHFMTNIYKLVE